MPIAALIRLLVGLLTPAFDGRRIGAAVQRAAIAAVFLLLAGLTLLTAVGLAGAALWSFVAPRLGSAGASLTVAGAFLVLALFLLLGGWSVRHHGQKPATAPPPAGTTPADAMLAAVGSLFGNNKAVLLVAALIAGLIAERMQKRD